MGVSLVTAVVVVLGIEGVDMEWILLVVELFIKKRMLSKC